MKPFPITTLTKLIIALSAVGVVALIAFFNAWTFAPYVVENKAKTKAGNKIEIEQRTHVAYAVSNGWHVGLVVPAGRINALLPDVKKRFEKVSSEPAGANQNVTHYEIGWGDQGFYEASEITTLIALQAMFNSPGSVVHVVAVNNPAKAFGGSQVSKFCLTEAQLVNLEKYIISSFATNADGSIISRRFGLYGDSQFYHAKGTYHFLNSCNTWVAKALRSAGFNISPTFKLFANQVMTNIDSPTCQATT